MDKTYDPAAVEARAAAAWEAAGAFRADRSDRAAAEPFTVVIPPPNVTGTLHMGHALNGTLQDALCRFERMRGRDVLWQPGTDHAGIATQMVVERQLAAEGGQGRREMGREAFLERVWRWKEESGGAITHQLKRLGASCDWSRERFTMDEGLSRAVAEFFVRLHEAGHVYRDKRLVNWDPRFQTAISDLEVVSREVKGRFAWDRAGGEPLDAAALGKLLAKEPGGHLYHLDYPVVDEGGAETGEVLTVATTRPETMLGDAAVAVNPEDERYAHLHGARVRLPLVGRLIPVVADAYSDPEKGTGAVKITPAHDFNDFEVGRRHGLAPLNVLTPEARVVDGAEADAAGVPPAFRGLERYAARLAVVAAMAAEGRLARVEPSLQAVPHGDRSGVAVEPYLTDQWYVDVKPLAERALAAVADGRTRFTPANWERTYRDWLENIQPWCVSRQLWWGHRVPAWFGPDGGVVVARNEAEARRLADAKWGPGAAIAQDEDVLDTWFSSALWPCSTLGWPDATADLARRYPTSVLVTGFDIIFFWVARMMMAGLFTTDEVPFREVYVHALVRDASGAKMSKSKGNVVDPIDLIDRYGADALRFTLAAMAAQGRDVKMSEERVAGYRNFATKLWNAARFAGLNGCAVVEGFDPAGARLTLNRWVLGEAARAVDEVTAALEGFRFNDAANAAYRFAWNVFCDWHLELAKPVLAGPDGPEREETRAVTAHVLDVILKLLHPFMPFLTEEVWALKGEEARAAGGRGRDTLLCLAPWPAGGGAADGEAVAEVTWAIALIEAVRSARSEMNVPAAALVPLVLVGADEAARGRAARWADTLKRLARVPEVRVADAAPPASVQVIAGRDVAALPLEGVVDLDAEAARLAKEAERLGGEVALADAKLGNADFVARAPDEVVEAMRERRDAALARRERVAEALARLDR